jgi:hypothetical protein
LLLLTVPILVVMEIYKFVKRNNENWNKNLNNK